GLQQGQRQSLIVRSQKENVIFSEQIRHLGIPYLPQKLDCLMRRVVGQFAFEPQPVRSITCNRPMEGYSGMFQVTEDLRKKMNPLLLSINSPKIKHPQRT